MQKILMGKICGFILYNYINGYGINKSFDLIV